MKFFRSNFEKKNELIIQGVVNSVGVIAYIIAVALFLSNGEKLFGPKDTIFAPIIMLTLFVLSALVTSLLILGKPAMLYFDGQKKESVQLLFYTIISLAALFFLLVMIYMLYR